MPGGLATRYDGRETSDRSLRPHDAVELVGRMCHGNARNHPLSRYIPQKNERAIECSSRHWPIPFARAKSTLLLKIHGSSEGELADNTADCHLY